MTADPTTAGPTTAAPDPAGWYARAFVEAVPRALTLLDRDRTSPTYGSFDRNHWHYRTQDFPSGMYQEYALALAQAHAHDLPGSRFRGEPRLREWAVAAARFAARSAHADGSCDDYYPNERALGATAFSAAACTGALLLLGERPADLVAFEARRARWLLGREESGRLANHQALAALAAARAARLARDPSLARRARERLETCLSWQHAEGWFDEYGGADPGYQTLTLAFLSAFRAEEETDVPGLSEALARGARFLAHFVHPDGTIGGEHGSRNTAQVLPSGLERLAATLPEARHAADAWLAAAAAGRRAHADDDRLLSHSLVDWPVAHAARAARAARGEGARAADAWRPPEGVSDFPGAGLLVARERGLTVVVATRKGGAFRAYRGDRLLRNDTGLVALGEDGARLATHLSDPEARVERGPSSVTVSGRFFRAPRRLATPLRQVAFRLGTATVGRVAPDLVRRVLQRALITGRRPGGLTFERTIDWSGPGLRVVDRVVSGPGAPRVASLHAPSDATSGYVAASQAFQEASLLPWEEEAFAGAGDALRASGACEVSRSWS
jgi:hypothetical protein